VSYTVTIPEQQRQEINRRIKRLMTETGRSVDDAISYAGLKIAESGRAIAKPGAKVRAVERNPGYAQQARNRKKWLKAFGDTAEASADLFPFYVIKLRQGGLPPVRIGVQAKTIGEARRNPKAQIRELRTRYGKRGLAHASWSTMVGKLGALKGNPNYSADADAQGARRPPSKVEKRTATTQSGRSVVMRLLNRIDYMARAYPGLLVEAMGRATRALDNRLQANIAKATREAGY
jgi:hypothetical protein